MIPASESTKGAGQYFSTRAVVQTIVEVMQPTPRDRIGDPVQIDSLRKPEASQPVAGRSQRA